METENGITLPTVSVVIPAYNYAHFIGEAIESALKQSYRPKEIIVVDDGSTDRTPDVCWDYLKEIQYIRQSNGGVSKARNTGIQTASGEWVAFLDADDLWHPQKLYLQMRCAAQHPEAALIGAFNSNAKTRAQSKDICSLLQPQDFFCSLPFGTSSAVVRRQELVAAGMFNEQRRYAEDRELWLKLACTGGAARVNRKLWSYRWHSAQAITQSARMAESYAQVLKEFFEQHPEFARFRPQAEAYFHFDAAVSFYDGNHVGAALRHLILSLKHWPRPLPIYNCESKFNRFIFGAKCLAGERLFRTLLPLAKRIFRQPRTA